MQRTVSSRLGPALCALLLCVTARADGALHSLWELHGKHNTVYLLGSIHVLRQSDYPLAPAVLDAYSNVKAVLMEVNLEEITSAQVQAEMLTSAILPEGKTLPDVLGRERYERADALAHEVGVELSLFDQFAPWFAAEAISQLQLTQLGFQPEAGVEMYFMERARNDGKSVAGLETVHDQISLFQNMPLDTQAEYLVSSLEQAHDLPKEVDSMVHAWQRGDMQWFENQLQSELGRDPKLYQSVLGARNRKWVPKIEALLNADKNYLVIVGTGHLAGPGSVIDLLKKDGIGATQR
jgi:uncharacterized protein YbaP (TraB family)